MKYQKKVLLNFQTTHQKREELKKTAIDNGMTITGMIKYAVKKIFGIEL